MIEYSTWKNCLLTSSPLFTNENTNLILSLSTVYGSITFPMYFLNKRFCHAKKINCHINVSKELNEKLN